MASMPPGWRSSANHWAKTFSNLGAASPMTERGAPRDLTDF
jgi:hypothetical protein